MEHKTALVSVYNKEGVADFCRSLVSLGWKIVSTGGTYKHLKDEGINATPVSEITGFPEILGGRVKTLHPKIHAGILAKNTAEHNRELGEKGIGRIDMVVVNLYPFKRVVSSNHDLDDALENIDIGGPTMIRAGAKNFMQVIVLTSPDDYNKVIKELKSNGDLMRELREELALKAFSHTADYDVAIANYFNSRRGEALPEKLLIAADKKIALRYGENPHQMAAFYAGNSFTDNFHKLQGKEISFNNMVDIDAAVSLIMEFDEPTAVILKHTNPCGAASSVRLADAYKLALSSDPLSAFGSIIAFNREVDGETALEVVKNFVEVVLAPSFSDEALKILSSKQNMRVIRADYNAIRQKMTVKSCLNGFLYQDADLSSLDLSSVKAVNGELPEGKTMEDVLFAWKLVKHTKSNAIVLVKDKKLLGSGAGQMSRVDSVRIAFEKAKRFSHDISGAVLASDAFFPFRDSIDIIAEKGVSIVVEPGGSKRDDEVIKASEEHGITLLFTGRRVFKH